MGYLKWFNNLSKVVKIIAFIPVWGWVFSALYRIFGYVDRKNTVTLVVGALCIIPVIGFVVSIIDLVTTAINGEPSILVD